MAFLLTKICLGSPNTTSTIDVSYVFTNYYLNTSANCLAKSSESVLINAITSEEMKKENSFIGFDFENVWKIDSNSEYQYPQLRNNLHY